jgi:hypothetical protein
MANGASDLRVGSNLAPQLLDQAVAAAHSITMVHTLEAESRAKSRALEAESRALEAESRALEAKSRAIHNIVVPVIAIATIAFVALRSRQ